MKPPLLVNKHLQFFCKFPLRKYNVFSTSNTPANYGGILEKMQNSCCKRARFFQMIGNNPAPYVACFLTCSHNFSMQNLCQKVQCINTIFPEIPARMTILLTNGSYSIRQYGILWIKLQYLKGNAQSHAALSLWNITFLKKYDLDS